MPSHAYPNFRLNFAPADPGNDAFNWLINWGDGSSVQTVASTVGYAEHSFAGSAGSYTMTFSTQGTPAGTTMPAAATATRGAEQTQYHRIDLQGGAGDPYYGDTTDLASSSIKLLQEYDALDSNHDGLYQECEHFAGTTDLAYVAIGSDIIQSVKAALEGQVFVNRIGSDGQHTYIVEDHTYEWPNDFDVTLTTNPGEDFDTYTVKYTLDVPEQNWTDGSGISWHKMAHVTGEMTVYPIQLTESADQYVTEGENSNAAFYFSRTNSSSAQQGQYTTTYKVGGDAVYGQRYTFVPDTSLPVSQRLIFTAPGADGLMNVTFPAGVLSGRLIVVPVNDNTPQWTMDITVVAADPHAPLARGQANPAVMDVVDDDLKLEMQTGVLIANFNDDNENGIPDYKENYFNCFNDPDLYELKLTFPAAIKPGAEIRLSGYRVVFWSDQMKTQRYGTGNDVTWIEGKDTIPTSVYVEVIEGGNIGMTLTDTDATADDPPMFHATSNCTPLDRDAVGVKMFWMDPNSQPNEPGEIEAGSIIARPVLVGQRLNVRIEVQAPANWLPPSVQWEPPELKVFDHWITGSDTARVDDVPWGDINEAELSSVSFVSAEPGSSPILAHVTIGGISFAPATTFTVIRPDAIGIIMVGREGWNSDHTLIGMFSAVTRTEPGVIFGAWVEPPLGYGKGKLAFLQLVKPKITTHVAGVGSYVWPKDKFGRWGLDNIWPYKGPYDTGPEFVFTSDSPSTDAPSVIPALDRLNMQHHFVMYIMFQPPGSGSEWVPVLKADWSCVVTCSKPGPGLPWTIIPGPPQSPRFLQISGTPPVWTIRTSNTDPGLFLGPP